MLSARPISLHRENDDYPRITASKTPGRALKGRGGLQENVLQNGSMTANPKEKRAALQARFHQGTSNVQASSKVSTFSKVHPLGDKTPKPNRQSLSLFTPGPRNAKPQNSVPPATNDEPNVKSPIQPPSTSRKTLRSPRISNNFKTPTTKGDYWNVSDVSIEEGSSVLGGNQEGDTSETDDSEPEYMPPKFIEQVYRSPFELPDYKQVGQTLRTLAYSYLDDDSHYVYQFDSEDLLKGCEWSTDHMQVDLSEYDDNEIFGHRKDQPNANIRTTTSSRETVKRPVSRLAVMPSVTRGATHQPRPATSMAICAPDPRPNSILSRPGTSTCKSRPLPSSRSNIRVASSVKVASSAKHGSEDMLASHFGDELEIDDDFRFTI